MKSNDSSIHPSPSISPRVKVSRTAELVASRRRVTFRASAVAETGGRDFRLHVEPPLLLRLLVAFAGLVRRLPVLFNELDSTDGDLEIMSNDLFDIVIQHD